MRSIKPLGAVYLCFVLVLSTSAQQSPAPPVQAPALLQSAFGALSGANPVTDVTLTGTARRIAGSDDETGTATLQATATGSSKIALNFPSGPRTEVRAISSSGPAGNWSGPDGVAHSISYHNLLTDPGLFPAFILDMFASSPSAVVTYVGTETHNGQAVQHISLSQTPPFPDPPGVSFAHLTQVDFFLDNSTFLPAALTFNIHPDDNELFDIPIEVRFSDYRTVNSSQVPFHIQKFLNNGLVLDLQFQTATLNSNLPPTTFNVGTGL
jgi:hypothetical protein